MFGGFFSERTDAGEGWQTWRILHVILWADGRSVIDLMNSINAVGDRCSCRQLNTACCETGEIEECDHFCFCG